MESSAQSITVWWSLAETPRFQHTDGSSQASVLGNEQAKGKPRQACTYKRPSRDDGTELSAAGMPHAGTTQARP